MSAFESSHKSLLQGVSQQVPRERLSGQLASQNNMLSDAVSNLRRRPGAEVVRTISTPSATAASVLGWDTDIGGVQLKILLDTNTGTLRLLDSAYADLQTLTSSYLIAADRKSIQACAVGERMVFANLNTKPTLGASAEVGVGPARSGFFYIKAGAFSKTYSITTTINAVVTTKTYTTPDGSAVGDAALATPEYIMGQLITAMASIANVSVLVATGGFAYIAVNVGYTLVLSSSMSGAYLISSGSGFLQATSDLPARLPSQADGLVVATTSNKTPVYFKYNAAAQAWFESGYYGAPGSLTNMPIVVQRNIAGTAWEFDTTPYEGMFSGDTISNPAPPFVTRGITGVGSFQGRLVILAGPTVNMSGSGNLRRWFRSTLTELIDSDPIQVGASGNSSAAYRHAIPFQKDLVLFSEQYQALVPSGNVAITPRNATVVITSSYEADMNTRPVSLGRTLAYAKPRSADFFGVLEMSPSQYTDSQYTSDDVTSHIPKYMPGRSAWSVSSSVANLALFGSTADPYSCTVHEYLWSGPDKVQQAWHKWTFPYQISDAFFSGAKITFVFVQNGITVLCTVDPKAGTLTSELDTRPFLDFIFPGDVVAGVFTLDTTLRTFDPTLAGKAKLGSRSGELAGEWVGTTYTSTTSATLEVDGTGFMEGPVFMGIPYLSSFSPTTPTVKDANGVVISSNKLTILRYMVGTANSGEYEVLVADTALVDISDPEVEAVLYWGSRELDLGHARTSDESVAIVPCRTNAATTTLLVSTTGLQELNLISLEYACKYNQKIKRR